jgi:hypothetical protein
MLIDDIMTELTEVNNELKELTDSYKELEEETNLIKWSLLEY